ncbi:MAG: isochorismatase family protein [Actinomycetota bacterium]|nr:isochorismatase family protein [Actinomycetota bacterium]
MATYDSSTALIVVDVQNDFADPNGSLYVSGGETIIPAVNEEMTRARDAGAAVVYTQDWHPESTPHFQKDGGIWPVHCVQDTWGADFHPDLEVKGEVVRKGTGGEDGYSGFTIRDPASGAEKSTELAGLLRKRGVERVVVVGLATDYCVKETALDAVRLGFETTVRAEAMRAVDLQPGDGDRAFEDMATAGARLE